jgi:hypothetical protein
MRVPLYFSSIGKWSLVRYNFRKLNIKRTGEVIVLDKFDVNLGATKKEV